MIGFYDIREQKIVGQLSENGYEVRGRLKEFLDTVEKSGEILFRTGESDDELAKEWWDTILMDNLNAPELLLDTLERLDIIPCMF